MSDLSEKIRATLVELHAELAAADQLDDDARAMLSQTAQEIEQKLHGAAPEEPLPARPGNLESRLVDAARDFDVSHPTLAGILNTLADALSRLGI